ncbi:FKBP-type peptidyl-prolyl cis-trans isomerase [Bernardetia sp. OM2101]|uniref:FKBP-type peptidyl-prolyl cis-trans isomerase n=1 Tax=Bernardetia sp. OM2101 TaxID=3344876 RepID=UPI0035CEFB34
MKSLFLYRFILFAFIGLTAWSCDSLNKEKELDGIRYMVRQRGEGPALTDSSVVQISMKIYNSKDSLLRDTYTEDMPIMVDLSDSATKEMGIIKILMEKGKEGDSVTMFIHSDSIFVQGQPRPPFIEEGSSVRQEIKLVKHFTPTEAEAKQKALQQEYMEKMMKKQAEAQAESAKISADQVEYIENTYFPEKGITDFKKTESGLFYTLDKQGKTDIEAGDKVKVNYEGTLLETGQKFDSSFDRGEPIEFPIGVGQVIKGWDEGIPLIGRGGKGTLYIPSNLGYGVQGSPGAIPPNAMLVFKVEVMEEVTKGEKQEGQNMMQGGGK